MASAEQAVCEKVCRWLSFNGYKLQKVKLDVYTFRIDIRDPKGVVVVGQPANSWVSALHSVCISLYLKTSTWT